MTLVTATIDIDAPPRGRVRHGARPRRLGDWVTIHRRVNHADDPPPREGYEMEQTLCLRGANFKVRWTLTEHEPPERATWEGRGPAHSYARTSYRLSPERRRRHPLRLRERVQGAGRLPRPGGEPRAGGRPARARGAQVAAAPQGAAGGLTWHTSATTRPRRSGSSSSTSPPLNLFGARADRGPPRRARTRPQADGAAGAARARRGRRLLRRRRRARLRAASTPPARASSPPHCWRSPTPSRTSRSPPSRSCTGLCLTAGLELSLACDLMWAAEAAQFGLVEAVVGITPLMGGTQRMAERAGTARRASS